MNHHYDSAQATAARHQLPVEAVQWVREGDRCQAADTLFDLTFKLDKVTPDQRTAPINIFDLRRAMLMIESIPDGRVRLQDVGDFRGTLFHRHAMLGVIDRWDQLKTQLDLEAPGWREPHFWATQTPVNKTVALLAQIVDKAQMDATLGAWPAPPRRGGKDGLGYISLPVLGGGALNGSATASATNAHQDPEVTVARKPRPQA